MLGVVDAFVLVSWSFLIMLPFVLLLGKVQRHDAHAAGSVIGD